MKQLQIIMVILLILLKIDLILTWFENCLKKSTAIANQSATFPINVGLFYFIGGIVNDLRKIYYSYSYSYYYSYYYYSYCYYYYYYYYYYY